VPRPLELAAIMTVGQCFSVIGSTVDVAPPMPDPHQPNKVLEVRDCGLSLADNREGAPLSELRSAALERALGATRTLSVSHHDYASAVDAVSTDANSSASTLGSPPNLPCR
jgi:hypothetical protein